VEDGNSAWYGSRGTGAADNSAWQSSRDTGAADGNSAWHLTVISKQLKF